MKSRVTARRSCRHPFRRRLTVESLDARRVLAAFVVTTVADTVDDTDGQTSLREAIVQANELAGADTITFEGDAFATAAEIDLAVGQLDITDAVTITGTGRAMLTIDGGSMSRLINIDSAAGDVQIESLTLTGGTTFGMNVSSAGVAESTFSGGAIRVVSGASTVLRDVTIQDSETRGNRAAGGAIFVQDGSLEIIDSELSGNTTRGGFAQGGAIAAIGADVVANRTTISGNATQGALSGGGAVSLSGGSALTMIDGVLDNNQTGAEDSPGGAIRSAASAIAISQSTVTGNQTNLRSSPGGAISSTGGTLAIESSSLTSNQTLGLSSSGGAVSVALATATIQDSLLASNQTSGTFSNGGALHGLQSTFSIVNATFSGNQTASENTQGGGLFVGGASTATITNATVTLNTAGSAGSGVFVDDGVTSVDINNSIIAGNLLDPASTATDVSPDLAAPSINLDVRFSLIGDNRGSGLNEAQTADAAGRLVGSVDGAGVIDAGLLALAANGGPTLSHQPGPGSPVIDAGSNDLAIDSGGETLTGDQRGLPFVRVSPGAGDSRVDMGAIEGQPPAEAIITWPAPANILAGTAIDEAQLNATTTIPGTFVYTPASGTVLPEGNDQTITLVFTPDDLVNYVTTTETVSIDVVGVSDHGDAPEIYAVLTDDDGAFHTQVADAPFLGSEVTSELNGLPSTEANLDAGDDGVTFVTSIVSTLGFATVASVNVSVSEDAKLDAWIDFDGDGMFDPALEHLGRRSGSDPATIDLVAGDNLVTFDVPAASTQGTTYARFRVSSQGGLSPTGGAADGEVEDYAVEILRGSVAETAQLSLTGTRINLASTQSDFSVTRGDVEVFRVPRSGIGRIEITADEFSNVLTIDQSGGNSIPVGGIGFDGGDRVNTVRVIGDLAVDTSNLINFSNVSAIDISDAGVQSVVVSSSSIRDIDPDGDGLVIIGGAEDQVTFTEPQQWRMGEPEIVAGTFFTSIRLIDLANPVSTFVQINFGSGWQNVVSPSDVNNNGEVTAGDALVIINELARGAFSEPATGVLVDASTVDPFPGVFYDQNNDGSVTALDALRVINQLARITTGNGESEAVFPIFGGADSDDDDVRERVFADEGFIGLV